MKSIKKALSTVVLGLTLFAFPVLACGEMGSGSKCLIQTVPTTETKPGVDPKGAYDLEKEFVIFVRGFFGKIFW